MRSWLEAAKPGDHFIDLRRNERLSQPCQLVILNKVKQGTPGQENQSLKHKSIAQKCF